MESKHSIDQQKFDKLLDAAKSLHELNLILSTLIISQNIQESRAQIPVSSKSPDLLLNIITVLGSSTISLNLQTEIFMHYHKLLELEKLTENEIPILVQEMARNSASGQMVTFLAEFNKMKDFKIDKVKPAFEKDLKKPNTENLIKTKETLNLEEFKENSEETKVPSPAQIQPNSLTSVKKASPYCEKAKFVEVFCQSKTLAEASKVLSNMIQELQIHKCDIPIASTFKNPELVSNILAIIGFGPLHRRDRKKMFLHCQRLKLQENIIEEYMPLIFQQMARNHKVAELISFFAKFYKITNDHIRSEVNKIKASLPKEALDPFKLKKPKTEAEINEGKLKKEAESHDKLAELSKVPNYTEIGHIIDKYPHFFKEIDYKMLCHALLFSCELQTLRNLCEKIPEIKTYLYQEAGCPQLDQPLPNSKDKAKKSKNSFLGQLIDYINYDLYELLDWDDDNFAEFLAYPPLYHTYAAAILLQEGYLETVSKVFKDNIIVNKLKTEIKNVRYEHKITSLFSEFEYDILGKLDYVDYPSKIKEIAGILNDPIIAFDCEWKPFGYAVPSIIQLASKNYLIILDIKYLYTSPEFQDFIGKLFTSTKIHKIGHSFIKNDFKFLNGSYGLPCFRQLKNFADIDILNSEFLQGRPGKSLSALAARFLSKNINKDSQKSNWDKRPLTEIQKKYAITDSIATLAIFEKMHTKVHDDIFKAFHDYVSKEAYVLDRYAPRKSKKDKKANSKSKPTAQKK